MARYVLTADLDFEGLPYKRGDVLNAPQGLPAVVAAAASLDAVPRARPAGLQYLPDHYVPVAVADQIGRQQSTLALPAEGTIKEPVLPNTNTQYD